MLFTCGEARSSAEQRSKSEEVELEVLGNFCKPRCMRHFKDMYLETIAQYSLSAHVYRAIALLFSLVRDFNKGLTFSFYPDSSNRMLTLWDSITWHKKCCSARADRRTLAAAAAFPKPLIDSPLLTAVHLSSSHINVTLRIVFHLVWRCIVQSCPLS